jgi:hypothetical protein
MIKNSNVSYYHMKHIKLVEKIHIFYLDSTVYNLKIYSFTFICLKLSTQLIKIIKIEAILSKNMSLTFSLLSLNDTLFRIFNLGIKNFHWVPVFSIFLITLIIASKFLISQNFTLINLNYQPLSWPSFSFWSLVLNLCIWLSIDQQTFIFFKLAPDLVIYNLYINAFFPVWYLVLDFFN